MAPVANMNFRAYGGIRWERGIEPDVSVWANTIQNWRYPMGRNKQALPGKFAAFYADRDPNSHIWSCINDADWCRPLVSRDWIFLWWLKAQQMWAFLALVYNNEDHNLKERKIKRDWKYSAGPGFLIHYLKKRPLPYWMRKKESLP